MYITPCTVSLPVLLATLSWIKKINKEPININSQPFYQRLPEEKSTTAHELRKSAKKLQYSRVASHNYFQINLITFFSMKIDI